MTRQSVAEKAMPRQRACAASTASSVNAKRSPPRYLHSQHTWMWEGRVMPSAANAATTCSLAPTSAQRSAEKKVALAAWPGLTTGISSSDCCLVC